METVRHVQLLASDVEPLPGWRDRSDPGNRASGSNVERTRGTSTDRHAIDLDTSDGTSSDLDKHVVAGAVRRSDRGSRNGRLVDPVSERLEALIDLLELLKLLVVSHSLSILRLR